MPNFLSTSSQHIYPVVFSPPIPAMSKQGHVLDELFNDLQKRISSGLFFLPNWQLTRESFQENAISGCIFTLKNKGITAYVIFTFDSNDNIIAVATNLDPNVFRKLMALSMHSMAFYEQLKLTEYWLPPMNSPDNIEAFTEAFEFIDSGKYQKSENQKYLPGLIETMHGFATRPEALLKAMKHPRAADNINNVLACAKKKLIANGTSEHVAATMAYQLTNPTSEYTKTVVAEQVVALLVQNKIVPAPHQNADKKLVLFIGEGDGQNMKSVQDQYPQFECFGLEPEETAAMLAHYRFPTEHRIFTATAEEFTLLLPQDKMKKFDIVIVLNYNVRSHTLEFMQALNYCVKENGQVVIGVSFNDLEYVGSNIPIASNLQKAFLDNPVKRLESDFNFTQRLYVVNGTSAHAYFEAKRDTAEKFANDPLTKKINDLSTANKNQHLQKVQSKNQRAFSTLNNVIDQFEPINRGRLNVL